MRLTRARRNDFHALSRKRKKELKRLGTKRQRVNGKVLIEEAA